jgi:hypothetical protein
MRRVEKLFLVLICTMLPAVTGIAGAAADTSFRATLSGKQEVPRVKTPAKGTLKLDLSDGELTYELDAEHITSPTAASIHMGRRGENGPPVAGIFGGPTKLGAFSGILAEGVITEKSLLGDLEGKSVADLVRLIKSGNAYVNILTETYPAGEIRGQIK